MARVLVLLTDGTGPLYNPDAADRMSDAVWWIADGLALDPDADPAPELLALAAGRPRLFTTSVCRGRTFCMGS